jgi:transcriptional regulator with XRE-family HTH domain
MLESSRRARGWSKQELARHSGLHPTTVIEATNGKRRPGSAQLAKLAAALNWPAERAEELLEEVDHAG